MVLLYGPLLNQMEITTKTIIFAVITVILIAAILGGIFYLLKNAKQLNVNNKTDLLSKLQTVSSSPTPAIPTEQIPSSQNLTQQSVTPTENIKVYQGQNFVLRYPGTWGIVTCNNSQNIEFDPYNKNDLKNYSCDTALKPITILVSKQPVSCFGENIKIGNLAVIRSKTETANWMKNRWCINKNGMSLDITNRVTPNGIRGTGKDDFSKQIEQIINTTSI